MNLFTGTIAVLATGAGIFCYMLGHSFATIDHPNIATPPLSPRSLGAIWRGLVSGSIGAGIVLVLGGVVGLVASSIFRYYTK